MPGPLERLRVRLWPDTARGQALPDFIGIGAQKAGTTWLAENLRCHPDVFLPERKELHWLDHKWDRPLSDWASHFAGAGGRVKGEITPAYALLPAARIRFLRRVLPELRLVLLLRDPVDRAWSQVVMELERAGRRPQEVPEGELLAALGADAVRLRSSYTLALDRWLAAFPAESLCVGFFEEIQEGPRELLARVFRHIGVSDAVDWARFPLGEIIVKAPREAPVRREEASPAACPEAVRRELQRRYAAEIEALAARFGAPARRWLAAQRSTTARTAASS